MNPRATHYEVLEVSPHASSLVIRAAYRYLAQYNHPDKRPVAADACARLTQINLAYSVLSDPEQRRRYDQMLHSSNQLQERRGRGTPATSSTQLTGKSAASRPFVFRSLR